MPEAPVAEAPKTHEFTSALLKSINKVVTPDNKVAETPPVEPEPKTPVPPKPADSRRTLGEIAIEADRKAKEEAKNPPPPTPPAEPATPPAPPVTPPAPAAQTAPPAPKLKKREAAPVAAPAPAPIITPPAPVVAPPPAAPATSSEDEYVNGLTPEQRDELQMAEFAEKKFPELKGKRNEVLGYFKKVDKFVADHPDTQPGSDEFNAFIESNKPKWSAGQKRKVETAFITDMATKTAREEVMAEVKPQLEAQKKRIREQELAPVISKAADEFETLIASPESVNGTMEALPAEVGKMIREKGYDAALEAYPVETPIYHSTAAAGREWMELTNGLKQFDATNPMHSWLLNFVAEQGRIYQTNPESTVNGRKFLPFMEYLELSAKNSSEAAKHWTFTDKDVLAMLATNGNLQYNASLSRLEKGGFKREKKKDVPKPEQNGTPPAPVPPPVPTTETPPNPNPAPSPRMRSGAAPGAAVTEVKPSPASSLIDTLIPGASKRIGIG